MVNLMKRIANFHEVNYIFIQPGFLEAQHSWKLNSSDLWRPWDNKFNCEKPVDTQNICAYNSKYKSGVDAAEERSRIFWRKNGARRIGLTEYFGIAMDDSHAANRLLPNDNVDPPLQGRPHVCLDDQPHEKDRCEQRYNASLGTLSRKLYRLIQVEEDAAIISELDRHLNELGPKQLLAEVTKNYKDHPVVHLAVRKGILRTIHWFVSRFGELVKNERDWDGYTALEISELDIEMSKDVRFYKREVEPDEDDVKKNAILRLLKDNQNTSR